MSKASTWTFPYTTERVLRAAQQKVNHHQKRLRHWEGEVAKAEADLKENGITFTETPQSGNSTTYMAAQPTFDNTKMLALRDAQAKVKYHRGELERFQRWVTTLSNAPQDMTLDLDYDDVTLFSIGEQA